MAPEATKIWNLDGSCSAERVRAGVLGRVPTDICAAGASPAVNISGQHFLAKKAGPWSGLLTLRSNIPYLFVGICVPGWKA